MNVPDWYEIALLSLAAWRVFQLIALDDITDGLRRWIFQEGKEHIKEGSTRDKIALFIECPYCAGFWIAVLWWAAWLIFPYETLVFAVPWVISAGVIGAAKILSSD